MKLHASLSKGIRDVAEDGSLCCISGQLERQATNIQAIAEELSLGLDALVLLDDNPVERGLVRQLLPEVAVPELPEEPAFYARTLAAAGYFEAVTFASEDLQRAEFYQTNAKRAQLLNQSTGGCLSFIPGYDDFISSIR